jgi:biotin synthase
LLPRITRLAEHVLAGGRLERGDAEYLSGVGGDDVYDLFYWANKIRIARMGRDVKFCAIVAAKAGGCSEDCKFCAQSAHHDGPAKEQSQLTDEQVLQSAWHAGEVGADSFGIVNSGRGPTRRELEHWLKPIMMKIAREGKTRACATLGALTPETAKFLGGSTTTSKPPSGTTRTSSPRTRSPSALTRCASPRRPGCRCAAAGFLAWAKRGKTAST